MEDKAMPRVVICGCGREHAEMMRRRLDGLGVPILVMDGLQAEASARNAARSLVEVLADMDLPDQTEMDDPLRRAENNPWYNDHRRRGRNKRW